MKKILLGFSIISVTIGIMLSIGVVTVNAETVSSGECGDNGDNITWTLDDGGTLILSGSGKTENFSYTKGYYYNFPSSEYTASPFKDNTDIKTVIISEGITGLGSTIFAGCSNLTEISLPSSLCTIECGAFINCESLSNVSVPKNVNNIGGRAFTGCTGLKHITIASGSNCYFGSCSNVSYSCDSVFDGCQFESAGPIGSNCDYEFGFYSIPAYAFSGCKNLKNITVPDNAKSIGEYAFLDCSNLSNITIPSGVTKIDDGAFQNCTNLASIKIPDSVTRIGFEAFYACKSLTSITIPDGVSNIYMETFRECTGLVNVSIPDSLTNIGEYAFCDCNNLSSINIPDNVTTIGTGAFSSCRSLSRINIPNGLNEICNDTFWGCSSLSDITIPDSVTVIGQGAFYECKNLESITIPENVTCIKRSAFAQCSSLKEVNILYGITSLRYSVNESDMSIGFGIFENCSRLSKVTIPSSVTDLGEGLFKNCVSLTSITIPDSVTDLGSETFYGCTSLTSIDISNSVVKLGESTFLGCNSLAAINLPDSVTEIGAYAFSGCARLTSMTIPNGVTRIAYNAFNGCANLSNVMIPDSVTNIATDAFYACKSLTRIIIPSSVTSIGDEAFSYCDNLASATIPNSVTSIGKKAFYSCSSSLTIYGTPGSEAENYAKNNSIIFKEIGSDPGSGTEPGGEINEAKGILREGDGWKIVWTVDYKVDSDGNKHDAILKLRLDGSNESDGSLILHSLLDNGFGMPWLTDEYDFKKSDFTEIHIIGGAKNTFEIISDQFSGYSNVEAVVLDNVNLLQARAFQDCSGLSSITISTCLKNVSKDAFDGCSSISNVFYKGTNKQWYSISVDSGNDYLINADIHFNGIEPVPWRWKRDNYAFTNSGSDYFGEEQPYYINTEDFADLLKKVDNTEIARMACWYGRGRDAEPYKKLNNFLTKRFANWDGACYGMSLTAALFKTGKKDQKLFGGNSTFSIPALDPSENSSLESFINYYQFTQACNIAIESKIGAFVGTDKFPETIDTLYNMAKSANDTFEPFMVNLAADINNDGDATDEEDYSHAVLCYGAEDGNWDYKGISCNRRLLIADPNETDKTYILISSDSKFAVYLGDIEYDKFGYREASLDDLARLNCKESFSIMTYNIILDTRSGVIITGKDPYCKVRIKDGNFYVDENSKDFMVDVVKKMSEEGNESDSDAFYRISGKSKTYQVLPYEGEPVNTTLFFNDHAIDIQGNIQSATVSDDGQVSIAGAEGEITVGLTANDSEFCFTEITGTANGDVEVSLNEKELSVAGAIKDYSITNMDRQADKNEVKVNGDTDTVITIKEDSALVVEEKEDDQTPSLSRKSIEKAKVTGITSKTYTGKALTQKPVVKVGGTTLKDKTDYKLSYKKNRKVGTATVTITGIGAYKGTITKTFKINPKQPTRLKITAASKGITAKWKKVSAQATGYQLQYAANSKFTSGKRTVTVKNYKTVSKKITKLKARKKYYVRIRTYKTVGGKKYYSKWSKAKAVKTKK